MTITYKNALSTKLGNHDNSTSKSSVSSKKRTKREYSGWIKELSVTIKKHNTRQGSSLFNVDKDNINVSKNNIVKNKSLVIKTNKKNKINEHSQYYQKAKGNNMLKSDYNKKKDTVNDETNNDEELTKRE